ncbi:MAG: succinate dehydrogenase cytochrome b subunit [Cyanobacteria bacterium P01_H01_bin.119]
MVRPSSTAPTPLIPKPLGAEPSPSFSLLRIYQSPIGKKLVTGLSGLALATFVLVHMVGNLLLFVGRDAYNAYAYHLEQWGLLLYLVEAVLLGAVLLHGVAGIQIFVGRLRSRPTGYRTYQSAGEPSRQSLSSRTMIVTGGVLALFLVAHLRTFKFGKFYAATLPGETAVRDLARLVIETFHHPIYAFGYAAVMVLLGVHLRHGIWSALQSLGAMGSGFQAGIYTLGTALAIAIALGFIVLPLSIYAGWVG